MSARLQLVLELQPCALRLDQRPKRRSIGAQAYCVGELQAKTKRMHDLAAARTLQRRQVSNAPMRQESSGLSGAAVCTTLGSVIEADGSFAREHEVTAVQCAPRPNRTWLLTPVQVTTKRKRGNGTATEAAVTAVPSPRAAVAAVPGDNTTPANSVNPAVLRLTSDNGQRTVRRTGGAAPSSRHFTAQAACLWLGRGQEEFRLRRYQAHRAATAAARRRQLWHEAHESVASGDPPRPSSAGRASVTASDGGSIIVGRSWSVGLLAELDAVKAAMLRERLLGTVRALVHRVEEAYSSNGSNGGGSGGSNATSFGGAQNASADAEADMGTGTGAAVGGMGSSGTNGGSRGRFCSRTDRHLMSTSSGGGGSGSRSRGEGDGGAGCAVSKSANASDISSKDLIAARWELAVVIAHLRTASIEVVEAVLRWRTVVSGFTAEAVDRHCFQGSETVETAETTVAFLTAVLPFPLPPLRRPPSSPSPSSSLLPAQPSSTPTLPCVPMVNDAEPPMFSWRGKNYLLKMQGDLLFLDKSATARKIRLGTAAWENPFLLPPPTATTASAAGGNGDGSHDDGGGSGGGRDGSAYGRGQGSGGYGAGSAYGSGAGWESGGGAGGGDYDGNGSGSDSAGLHLVGPWLPTPLLERAARAQAVLMAEQRCADLAERRRYDGSDGRTTSSLWEEFEIGDVATAMVPDSGTAAAAGPNDTAAATAAATAAEERGVEGTTDLLRAEQEIAGEYLATPATPGSWRLRCSSRERSRQRAAASVAAAGAAASSSLLAQWAPPAPWARGGSMLADFDWCGTNRRDAATGEAGFPDEDFLQWMPGGGAGHGGGSGSIDDNLAAGCRDACWGDAYAGYYSGSKRCMTAPPLLVRVVASNGVELERASERPMSQRQCYKSQVAAATTTAGEGTRSGGGTGSFLRVVA
ncbi:unnamed protein product, partial [Phaeothamnion confervicola]